MATARLIWWISVLWRTTGRGRQGAKLTQNYDTQNRRKTII
jgi:hypothetical protein